MSLKERLDLIESLNQYTLEIGIQGTSIAEGEETGDDLVTIAAYNEFGTTKEDGSEHIPSRPWMRTTVDLHTEDWKNSMRKIATLAVRGESSRIEQGFRLFGLEAVNHMQDTLQTYEWKPNSPVTIAAKGSSKPLIDSSQLLQSHRAAIKKGDSREIVA